VRGGNLLARRGVKHSCFRLDLPFVSAEAGTQDVAKS
jgi:hypothetical protein